MEQALDTDKRFCSILLDVVASHGVRDVVCSPGSRNAPLLVGTSSRKEFRKHVVIDERSAAFTALGMSLVSKKPVALICTSGTALLNYAPAIAEAYYQSLPLIVISADRPKQWIDQDDSQTLRQFESLSNFVKKSYELPAMGDDDSEMRWYANRIANDAMIEALSGRKGPVHINVPLGGVLGRKRERTLTTQRVITMVESDGTIGKKELSELTEKAATKRVMFVAGFMPPDSGMIKWAGAFSRLDNVATMAETLSNLHLDSPDAKIDSVLTAFTPEELDRLAPDIVISVGGAIVSRMLKEYLRRNKGKCEHWGVGFSHTTTDCYMSLTKRIEIEPSRFLRQLCGSIARFRRRNEIPEASRRYRQEWRELKRLAVEAKEEFLRGIEWSELKFHKMLYERMSREVNLFLSNGTSVRYNQLFNDGAQHATYCNRGVSGIDGSGSTAIGGAWMYAGPTVLVTGDMSMAYDIGSLSLPDIPETMKIIVVDNSGGGIFRFIESTRLLEEREEFFCVPPKLPLRQLAEGYGWDYGEVTDTESFNREIPALWRWPRKKIVRVAVNGEESAELLRRFMGIKIKN